jgi:hypothetical protein
MSYSVDTTGTLLLPESLERQALTVLEVELAGRQGSFNGTEHVDDLASLAAFAGADVRRDGDSLRLGTVTGHPQWSDQATAFYVGLARWVQQGEVHLVGQDGARWSYRYGPDGVIQVGQNGWDGSLVPFGGPVEAPTARQTGPTRQLDPADPWADPEPRNRTFAMTMLLLVGIVLIVGVAMLGAGLFG